MLKRVLGLRTGSTLWNRIQRIPVNRYIRSQLVGAARTDCFCFAEIQVASPGRTPGCDTFASLPELGGQGNTVRGFVSWNIHRLRIPSYTNTFEEADFGHLKIIFLQYFLRFELIQNCCIDRRWHRAYLAYCPAIRYCSFHQCFAQ